ncbi:MAG: hypothetical protein AB7O24_29845 [Kofleriaceae bacterium]
MLISGPPGAPTWREPRFVVTETPAVASPVVAARRDGEPYREPGDVCIRRPGIAIAWGEDKYYVRAGLLIFGVLSCGGVVAAGVLAGVPAALFIGVLVGTFGVALVKSAWRSEYAVSADLEGLSWRRRTLFSRSNHLPVGAIERLFVRKLDGDHDDKLPLTDTFSVQVRATDGRMLSLALLEHEDQAQWMVQLLEANLRPIDLPTPTRIDPGSQP